MTDAGATWQQPFAAHPPTPAPPGTVVAAAAITWTVASATLVGTVLALGVALWLGDPILDMFEDQRFRRTLALLAAVVACAAADYLAWLVHRGFAWARWALVVLSVLAALVSFAGYLLVVPLAVSAACIAVVALLFVGESAAWFRGSGRDS